MKFLEEESELLVELSGKLPTSGEDSRLLNQEACNLPNVRNFRIERKEIEHSLLPGDEIVEPPGVTVEIIGHRLSDRGDRRMVAGIVARSTVQVVREQLANEVAPVWVIALSVQRRFQIEAGRINAGLGSRVTDVTWRLFEWIGTEKSSKD